MKNLVILTGAGMSAESGIQTFRDMGGLWEEHDIMEVASPKAWLETPELVLRFYNQRRKELFKCKPHKGHYLLSQLEKYFTVNIITQNIDDLHERAGSSRVLHLHGELKKARSTINPNLVYELKHWELKMGMTCEKGSQLRPHVVWFGESVPAMKEAIAIASKADLFLIIGTSLNVYPAAGLIEYVPEMVPIYLINPDKPITPPTRSIQYINEKAGKGIDMLKEQILKFK